MAWSLAWTSLKCWIPWISRIFAFTCSPPGEPVNLNKILRTHMFYKDTRIKTLAEKCLEQFRRLHIYEYRLAIERSYSLYAVRKSTMILSRCEIESLRLHGPMPFSICLLNNMMGSILLRAVAKAEWALCSDRDHIVIIHWYIYWYSCGIQSVEWCIRIYSICDGKTIELIFGSIYIFWIGNIAMHVALSIVVYAYRRISRM